MKCRPHPPAQLRVHLPLAKNVLQEIIPTPRENDMLKRLSRHRRILVDKKSLPSGRSSRSVYRGLLDMAKDADNLWFLRFNTSVEELTKLSRLRLLSTSLKIPGMSRKYASDIVA